MCSHVIIMDLWLSIGVNYLEITCVHLIFINTNIFVIIGGGERPTPTLNPEPCRHLCLADMSNENIFYLPFHLWTCSQNLFFWFVDAFPFVDWHFFTIFKSLSLFSISLFQFTSQKGIDCLQLERKCWENNILVVCWRVE